MSKIKATEVLDSLSAGDEVRLILGDAESFKSVAQELRARGIKPSFEQDGENRFVLTIIR